MKRLAVFLTALFTIFALNGCNAIDSTEETSDEAYICIGAETARTIMPVFDWEIEKMRSFFLYGKTIWGLIIFRHCHVLFTCIAICRTLSTIQKNDVHMGLLTCCGLNSTIMSINI